MELCIHGGLVLDPADDAPKVEDLWVRDGRIVHRGARRAPPAHRRVDARDAFVLPGLIQSHVHLAQCLFRGMAEGLPLLPWLETRIWPLESAHDRKSLRASARLAALELVRSGTTTVLDMGAGHDYDTVIDAAVGLGLRVMGGPSLVDRGGPNVPRRMVRPAKANLDDVRALATWAARRHPEMARIVHCPRFVLSCSRDLLEGAASEARELGGLVHTHAAEHAEERKEAQRALGMTDIAALRAAGISGPRAILAHGVQLRPAELRRMAREGTRLVHCPSTNLKLGSGIADVQAWLDAGIVPGIGSDGAPCNNRHDAFTELRAAGLLPKGAHRDATRLGARDVFRLATTDAASLLGFDGALGSLAPGAIADIVVVTRERPELALGDDPYATLLYGGNGSDVRHVFVAGVQRVRDGELVGVDTARIVAGARAEARRVAARAGL